MNMDLWKDCDNIILWGVEYALVYNLLDVLQHQNVYALVPNNELKQALKKKLEEQNFEGSLKIEQAYLNDKGGEATLREFSLPQMNSLKAPSGILDIYPGLKQLQMQSVKCLSPSSLLAAYELTDQMDNTLWLEVNGQVTSTIQGLIESEKVYLFTRILVFMPKQAWYESEVDAEALIKKLKQIGYDVSNQIVDLDSDQGLYEFTIHPLVLEKKALECEVERLNQALEQLQSIDIKLARQKLDEYVKNVSELQVKIDEVSQARDVEAKTVEEQKVQIQQVTSTKEQQAKLVTECQGQIEKLIQERDVQMKLSSEREMRIDSLTTEKDQKTQKNKELESNLKTYQQEIEAQKTELSEARQSAQLSLKLQMLKEVDLKDLQIRYQEMQQVNERQDKLLNQLSERLQIAARYFHELVEKNNNDHAET